MKIHLRIVPGIDQALVLMSPNHEIEEFGKEVFGKIACFRVGMTADVQDFLSLGVATSPTY